jgi:hypothetical protein
MGLLGVDLGHEEFRVRLRYERANTGNVTDEQWARYINDQAPREPGENTHVSSVRRTADRSGFELSSEATAS